MKFPNYKILVLLIFAITYLLTLNQYGFTWDEPIHLVQGKENWEFLSQGKPFTSFGTAKEGKMPAGAYGAVTPLLAYLSNSFFTEKLKILPSDSSVHLVILPFILIGLFSMMNFCEKYFSKKTAFFSAVFLIAMPRLYGHLHQNFKDVPSAFIFAVTIFAYVNAVNKPNIKNWLLASFSFGLALSLKINSFQIPLIILSWLFIRDSFNLKLNHFKLIKNFELKNHKLISNLKFRISNYLFPLISFLLSFLIWLFLTPPLWNDPVNGIPLIFEFFQVTLARFNVLYFGKVYLAGVTLPWHFPLGMIFVTTPILTLFFALVGILISIKKTLSKNNITIKQFNHVTIYPLLFLWFTIPLSKYILLKTPVFDDIRHFMEVLFPLAIFAALGLTEITNLFRSGRITRTIRLILPVACAFLTCYFIFPFFRLHPYEIVYFNEIVGGVKNVYQKNLFEIDFWGSSLKESTNWINANARKNDTLYSTYDVFHLVNIYKRDDLKIDYNNYQTDKYLIILNRKTYFYPHVMEFLKNKKPVFVVEREGVPLSWLYQP